MTTATFIVCATNKGACRFGRFGYRCASLTGITQEIAVRRTVSVAERRGWERLPISIPFFVRGTTASGEEFLEFATALNLSAGGVLLATRRYLEPGTQLSLEIPVALANKAQLPRSVSHVSRRRCCDVPPTASTFCWDYSSVNRSWPNRRAGIRQGAAAGKVSSPW